MRGAVLIFIMLLLATVSECAVITGVSSSILCRPGLGAKIGVLYRACAENHKGSAAPIHLNQRDFGGSHCLGVGLHVTLDGLDLTLADRVGL